MPQSETAVDVLMAIDEPRAIQILANALPDTRATALRAAVARALRNAHARHVVVTAVETLYSGADMRRRVAAIEIAGWIPWVMDDATIERLAFSGRNFAEIQAAVDAAMRRRKMTHGRTIIGELANATDLRSWSLSEILTAIVDPWLLGSPDDELSIGSALKDKSEAFRMSISDELNRRAEAFRKEAEQRDRDRRWL